MAKPTTHTKPRREPKKSTTRRVTPTTKVRSLQRDQQIKLRKALSKLAQVKCAVHSQPQPASTVLPVLPAIATLPQGLPMPPMPVFRPLIPPPFPVADYGTGDNASESSAPQATAAPSGIRLHVRFTDEGTTCSEEVVDTCTAALEAVYGELESGLSSDIEEDDLVSDTPSETALPASPSVSETPSEVSAQDTASDVPSEEPIQFSPAASESPEEPAPESMASKSSPTTPLVHTVLGNNVVITYHDHGDPTRPARRAPKHYHSLFPIQAAYKKQQAALGLPGAPEPPSRKSPAKKHSKSSPRAAKPTASPAKASTGAQFENLQPVSGSPMMGDLIAFKTLDLAPDYTPTVSAWKEALVVAIQPNNGQLQLKIHSAESQLLPPANDDSPRQRKTNRHLVITPPANDIRIDVVNPEPEANGLFHMTIDSLMDLRVVRTAATN
ncbi:hypothetical protein H4R33_003669 [Dimargaris cristalligena]|uniref:Coilin tudor domain-containing protein n=1 Tax=Dimargaris cristalligena TaxID=215637 RepID=A0A4P9ZRY1_9FUNG|nr:hypothetical protein H4R33_003669 [Dimargaris cristalligena]RKP35422.1 hypothetical protein BJ085DRAFT_36853 [Dimargaris cristalligena]|eukprot:RKP35422.1 hypothetical protein BJ085DRAFT_36853 [Dimargaris cristalligena]